MSKTIVRNKKAYFDYEIIDEIEAGIVLTGGEVKSIKEGKISLKESFIKPLSNSLFLINANISKWVGDTTNDYDSTRSRKLLLNRKEIDNLILKNAQQGTTIVPLCIYLKNSLVKVKIGLGKGRNVAGKKKHLQERDVELDMKRDVKNIS